ncbi:hypothetical protein HID58_016517 [Brassica napus]|uniref:Protein FAM136A n=1 Tax=Brassica napus TaxID=3708 RepID=A0ABQ8DQJ7_BRANA|nr:hypothetical protein HID58_016517 [Brassica napus]
MDSGLDRHKTRAFSPNGNNVGIEPVLQPPPKPVFFNDSPGPNSKPLAQQVRYSHWEAVEATDYTNNELGGGVKIRTFFLFLHIFGKKQRMDPIEEEEKKVRERIRNKVNQVSSVSQSLLSPLQDHINFTLQKAYFKCAYECFDRTRTHAEISQCAETCSERLNRSLVACQDKFEAAKLQRTRNEAVVGLEQCVNQTVDDAVKTLPSLVSKMKKALSVSD